MENNKFTPINNDFCVKCGKPINNRPFYPINTTCQNYYCTCGNFEFGVETPKGWICPVCGCGVNPNEKICPCNIKTHTTTYSF